MLCTITGLSGEGLWVMSLLERYFSVSFEVLIVMTPMIDTTSWTKYPKLSPKISEKISQQS